MRKNFARVGITVIIALYFSRPGLAFDQTECNQLKQVQSDPAGREMTEKLQADAQGNCKPEPPNSKEPEAPAQNDTQSPSSGRQE
jgi:hypothetical protein